MAQSDERKDYLLSTIANYYRLPNNDPGITSLEKSDKLNNFLDDGNSLILSGYIEKLDDGGTKIHLDNKAHVGLTENKVIVFFKSKPDVVTPENMHKDVLVSSMLGSPVSALYHALQKVYSPLLLKDAKWSNEFDPKLQGLITELEKGLGSIVRRHDPASHKGEDAEDSFDALSSILTPMDETQYWADVANSAQKKEERKKATEFWQALEPMSDEFSKIGTMQLQDAEDVLETCYNCLDDLWRLDDWIYPQQRMVHLMNIIANALTRFIQSKCSSLDLWHSSYSQVEEALNQGIHLCDKWIDTCQMLISIFWSNYAPHMWQGAPHVPEQAVKVKRRLKEIHSLRTLHKQLTQLLSNAEQEELKTSKSFEPFADLNPVQYNPYTEPQWQAAVAAYGNALVPAENRIAGKLKSQLRNMNANTLQFLQEFKRYQELIKRPAIQRELVVERENLLGKLSEFINREKKEYRDIGPSKMLHGIPKTINSIYFIRQLEAKVKDITRTGDALLHDLKSWPTLKTESTEFLEEMTEYQRELFDSWCRDNLQDIEGQNLSLKTSSQVVYFEAGKDMKVSYNPRLVGLTREVRMLTMLGFAIPQKILETTDLAKKFASQAKTLDQIANFHNTIGDRMITSQRPMMLEAALGLAQLVKEQSDMTWDNSQQVQRYIEKLKSHVDQLARQNNKLATYHKQIKAKWKEGLKEIRQIMTQVEQDGFTNLKTWRNHWDRQLYKTLEHQYQVGLEALNEHLPEIPVDLIYRQQQLQFSPPIEEIKMKYFSQLKRFLAIPYVFKGVSESSENLSYPSIIDRNAHRFSHLFKKAEDLFSRLETVKVRYVEWVALGAIDIEDYIQKTCSAAEDWELNFRTSKARGQEFGRLRMTSDEKIDCITVSFAPIRNEIDLLNKKYWDSLVSTLQRSIVNDIDNIEKFVTEATENLRRQPQTVEEVAEANQKHTEYQQKTPDMMETFHRADSKNKTLAAWTKEHMEQVQRVTSTWDNYISLMDNHQNIISAQVEAIKANLNTQVNNVNGELEKFRMRWDQLKPKEDSMEGDSSRILSSIQLIKEKRSEWNALMENQAKIISDHTHFGLQEPEFPILKEVEQDLNRHEEMWGLFDEFNRSVKDMSQEEWIIFRSKSYKFEEFLTQWYERLNNASSATTVTVRLLHEIEKYKVILPVLKYVRGDSFSDQHWTEMYQILGMSKKPVDKLVFNDFLQVRDRLVDRENDLKDLNDRAAGEVVIRQALSELDVWEVEAKFSFLDHQTSTGQQVPLIREWKDVLNKVLLQSIKGSAYYNTFGDRASGWETKLSDLDEILNNLNTAQRKWVYLEPYQEQMKMKSLAQTGGFDYREVFRKIDDDFQMIMTDAQRDKRVVALLRIGSIKSILNNMLDRLERCQKSLNDFLEEKRSSFPRFYFIGDDDLLQILGQATKPAIIQTHLKKLFAGIHNVNFDEQEQHIVTMNSIEGEVVELKTKIKISSEVEGWLSELAREMKRTLQELLVECLNDAKQANGMDPLKYPSQVLCLAEAILFTERCEEAIARGNLKSYLRDLESQLESYTSVDLGDDIDSKVLELKLKALILDNIHHIKVTQELIEANTKNKTDWLWQKQLRYYLASDNIATISMVDANFQYTYEYQGNAPKLVHTPLTDKCYLTLTQGMRVGLGGNPYGPAGTGKTESVKALGGLFGRQVLVFNCDEGIDVKSMGRIFIGLIKCGAWGCFDEFNRLEEQTLSALFRPVAMSRPDNDLIAEVSLYSEGFKDAKNLGQKLVSIFNLSKRLLTPQQHYDWGLRALKTVLKGCGNMLKMSKKDSGSDAMIDSKTEAEIVVQALRLNTLSKLTFTDSVRFDDLVKDVFPGITFNTTGYEQLQDGLRESCTELGFNINENQIKKAVELYEQLQQRMGVVIVGPSGSGKTTLFTLLKHALTKMGRTVKQHTMNPKAIPRSQLLGSIDLDTREWTNGVLTLAALEAVDEPGEINTWIVCDGDIDPEWVESLNSVLDDNRLLTLPSGWRIQFGPNVNFIFETHDLSYASPATISRMGMIFLSDEDTDIKGIVTSWLHSQAPEVQETLPKYMEEYFFKAVDWCQKQNDFVIDTSLVGCVLNGLSHMNGVGNRLEFIIALVRGLGGNLKDSSKETFAKEVFSWVGESPPGRNPTGVFYNRERDRIETHSSAIESNLSIGSFADDSFPLVKTADAKAAIDCLLPWLQPETQQPFLLVGPEGCGKSLILKDCFKKLRSTNVAVVHCSAHITPQHVIQKLSQVCLSVSSSNGRVLRPKECDRLVLYLKDLNLASPDKYGTCMLIAFLQQVLTYGGFYDNNLEWVGLEAIQIVGSMTAGTGLGRHALNTRFTSTVRVYSLDQPNKEYLEVVYTSYLGAVLRHISPNSQTWSSESKVSQLAGSMVSIYQQLKQTFSVDDQSHYLFTSRDLTEWCLGLIRYVIGPGENSAGVVLEPWTYEACRLFRDKLANAEDVGKFDSIMKATLQSEWNSNVLDSIHDMYFVTCADASYVPGSPMPKFGHNIGKIQDTDWEHFVDKGIVTFGRENRDLDVAIIDELLDLVARCDRVLSKPGGSLLMSGRAGVGRRTACSITAAMHQAKLMALKMGKNYGPKQFKTDLKNAMQVAGVEEDQVFLLLEDHNFGDLQYLDMINSLLSSGEVPGLYSPEELEPLLTPLRAKANDAGFSGNLFTFFAKCVRKNLHIILIMDCSNPAFVVNCESNPALYKECQVLWLEEWSERSMIKLPQLLLTKEERKEGENIGQKKEKKKRQVSGGEELLRSFYKIHASVTDTNATPKKYVTFIKTYETVYAREKDQITSRQGKLSKGVSKLTEARDVVHKLKAEAAIQEKELAEKQAEANEALQMITDTMKNANTQKGEMENLKSKTLEEEKNLNVRKKEIEVEMAEIQPLVEEAKKAVGNIKSQTLSEIRSLRAPPEVIRDILEGVLRLMGTQDTSWNSMKSFLARRGIKDEILSFDARRISSKNRQIVEKLLEDRSNSFDPAVAKRASGAAAPLASWVLANVKFSYVLEKVKPLEAEQAKLQRNLRMAEDQIGNLSTGLDEVDQQVAILKERLNKFTKEAAEVEIHLNKTKETITAADSLVEGLEGEFTRWNQEVESMTEDLERVPQFSLLGSAFLVYLSNAPENERKRFLGAWQEMLGINKFDLNHFLSSERDILQWRSEGLPSDNLSVENAMCILQSILSPYLIDPSSRAAEWLKVNLGTNEAPIEVATQADERFVLTLELAIRFGKTLLLQEVNSIDPILFPILRGDLVGQGPYMVVQVGEKQVDYNPIFRLFMTTRNPNPDIPPDATAIVSTVNFTTTKAGLTGQLLAAALQHEKPELEQRKSELLKKEEENKIQISKLEDFLLEQLANSSGNILENKELLASLNETKDKSKHIAESLKESSQLQDNLEVEGNVYLPLAEFASHMYFKITDLVKINNMYRTSLAAFLKLYQMTLKDTNVSAKTGDRIEVLKESLLIRVYHYISRSLFKGDRLTFAMHLVHGMYPALFEENEWETFTGLIVEGDSSSSGTSVPSWIDDERRQAVGRLKALFPTLYANCQVEEGSVWHGFSNAEECELELPIQVSKNATLFQQVLLVQALRPDRLVSSMEHFVSQVLNLSELSPPALSLKALCRETVADEPILIIISSGSDPSEELGELASDAKQTLHEVAMGQGQADLALEKLALAAEQGIKRNLQRTLNSWNPDVFNQNANPQKAQTVFALAWFHGIVQERRTFIPQGWCKFYEFSDSDLKAGLEVLDQLNSGNNEIKWDFVHGLYGNAIYGGRVDDAHDIKILNSYLKTIFNSEVIPGSGRALKQMGPFDLPASTDEQDFAKLVNKLPEDDKPSMFGLPANIERSYQRTSSLATINQLKLLMRSVIGAAKFEREKWQKELTPVLNLWKKLNSGSSMLQVKLQAPSSAGGDPIQSFVELEYFNGVKLLQTVHKSLSGLSKVIRGTALLDEKVSKLADSLLKQVTPSNWQKLWDGPEDPMAYTKAIVEKANEIQKWKGLAEQGSLLNNELDMADLFHPDTFLGALRQLTAREYGIAMDELKFVNTWSRNGINNAKLPIQIGGVMIEGASFDGSKLVMSSHDAPTFSMVPPVTVGWVPESSPNSYHENEAIRLPLYYSSEREKIVSYMDVPSGGDNHKWLQAGTVLFLNSHI
ncbi:hypothetical protein TCAL_08574 [Tigriopus californicus]|uniref:Cytoplasmic dynein 2 heavy chain 1 n=1 Tax=Tigriopus californicus TaxID=6832 RepID=A0A553PBP8_TIGCA|nr:hypothetical protein TCAL_08574 [Tigriopus californicus]|eukprot:TCALIF_08574-PA protein Name:"Similar to DYH1B Cytoplasmic dynein 2 heavy chain 1 (Tripneustes gratilla)" AED:0.03 eAED:0.03 QI:0/0.54/0/1/1/1/12/0/4146